MNLDLATRQQHYDLRTAVTFLLAGLGLGSLLAILLTPRPRVRLA